MTFRYRPLASGLWEVLRSDGMLMFVDTYSRAKGYCDRKNAEMTNVEH